MHVLGSKENRLRRTVPRVSNMRFSNHGSLRWLAGILFCSMLQLTAALPALIANGTSASIPEKRLIRELSCKVADDVDLASDNIQAYAPVKIQCPKEYTWIRPADSLSQGEKDYLNQRSPLLKNAWTQRLKDVGLNASPRMPVVAMALSGGGYRAMISGSGMAFQQNNSVGSVGDLLGISTYVSGLSGGGWALASFFANDGIQPSDLAKDVSIVDCPVRQSSYNTLRFRFGTSIRTCSFPVMAKERSSLICSAACIARIRRILKHRSRIIGD
jgi:hypothetical protein